MSRFSILILGVTLLSFCSQPTQKETPVEEDSVAEAVSSNYASGQAVRFITFNQSGGERLLTDGQKGSLDDKRSWVTFENEDVQFVLDLGQERNLSNVTMNFGQLQGEQSYFPEHVAVHGSTDGKAYRPIGTAYNQNPLDRDPDLDGVQSYIVDNFNTRVRYLLVAGKPNASAEGDLNRIIINEIEVN